VSRHATRDGAGDRAGDRADDRASDRADDRASDASPARVGRSEESAFLSRPFLGEGFHVREALDDAAAPVERPLPKGLHAYTLGEALGSGTFATVYAAEQHTPVRRRVAVKVLHAELNQRSAAQRFQREWQALAGLEHPGIARLYEAGLTADNRLYLAMELVDGEPLDTGAARQNLSHAERVRLVRDACRAVHHAHIKGIVHRDLKPANILLAAIDEGGGRAARPSHDDSTRSHAFAVKVIDFGMAKAISTPVDDSSLRTVAGQLVGTVPYMAPEQLEGRVDDVDVRTDVYAMGVILYELIAARRPHSFAGVGPIEAARMVKQQRPPALRTLAPSTSRDLDRVVAMALSVDPQDRYQSMAEFAADLDRVLADVPVMARPPTAVESFARWTRRHPVPASMAALLVSFLAVLVVLGWSVVRGAERQVETASRTVQGYLRAVVRMEQVSGAIEIRRDLLEDATRLSEELLRAAPNDLDTLRTHASVLVALSSLERETSRTDLSIARALRAEAHAIRERVLASGQATSDDRRAHAMVLILRGDIDKEEGRIAEAKSFYEAAMAAHRELVRLDPGDLPAARQATFGLERLGDLAELVPDPDLAQRCNEEQLVEAERLRAAHPDEETLRWDVCVARSHLIHWLLPYRQFERAAALIDASIADAAALVAFDPDKQDFVELYANSLTLKALQLLLQERPEEALPLIAQARPILERLARDNLLGIESTTRLQSALSVHARVLEMLGGDENLAEARRLAERCSAMVEQLTTARPNNPSHQARMIGAQDLRDRLRGAAE